MALTATVDAELQVARLAYDVPVAGNVTIVRAGPSGQQAGVRGWVNTPSQAGQIIARDFEVPLGVAITYTATTKDAGGAVVDTRTATITVPSEGCEDTWLNDL